MRTHVWIALLLFAATLAVFYQVHGHDFVGYDDYMSVVQNPNLRGDLGISSLLRAFEPYYANWIPLTWISLQIDYALYGLDASGYLLTNVAFHVSSAILLYLALVGMTGAIWRSAFVAAVFAIHPLHVESVAWVTERKDTLSGLFWMLTLCAYGSYAREPESRRRYALVLLCVALGLMAKPMLVTLPFVLLLLDYWPLDRLRDDDSRAWPRADLLRAALVEKIPMFGMVAVASAVTYFVQRGAGTVSRFEALPLSLRIQNAVESYAIYVWTTLWPTNLAAFYPHPLTSIGAGRLLAASVFVGVVSVAVVRTAAKRPYALVGWFWYLGTLIPVIGLVQVGMQARADRYMYLPLIGLSIAISWGAVEFAEQRRVPRAALAATAGAILVALGIGAWRQTATWRSSRVLYAHALSVTEDNFLAHKGFGNALLLDTELDAAAYHFGEAARIAPEWPDARLGLADVDMARGRIDTALRAYERELERDPDNINTVGRYGIALGVKGRYAEARPLLERAVAARSGIVELHLSLSIVEAELGRPRKSLRYAREALRIDPNLVEASNGLAWTLATCADPAVRDAAQAIREIERIALESGDPGYLDTLAAAYAAAGRFDDAVATAQRAAEGMEQMGRHTDASAFRARLSLYRQGTPYVDSRDGR